MGRHPLAYTPNKATGQFAQKSGREVGGSCTQSSNAHESSKHQPKRARPNCTQGGTLIAFLASKPKFRDPQQHPKMATNSKTQVCHFSRTPKMVILLFGFPSQPSQIGLQTQKAHTQISFFQLPPVRRPSPSRPLGCWHRSACRNAGRSVQRAPSRPLAASGVQGSKFVPESADNH